MSQSQHPFVFPYIATATQHWVALGSVWAKVLAAAGGGAIMQRPTARDKEGLPGDWGGTLGEGQQHSQVGLSTGGRTWRVAETRYQGRAGLPHASQDTRVKVARTSSI